MAARAGMGAGIAGARIVVLGVVVNRLVMTTPVGRYRDGSGCGCGVGAGAELKGHSNWSTTVSVPVEEGKPAVADGRRGRPVDM